MRVPVPATPEHAHRRSARIEYCQGSSRDGYDVRRSGQQAVTKEAEEEEFLSGEEKVGGGSELSKA